jgi:ubiquinone/menaquinone biosynthesis C-methylase UbiE
MRASQRLLVVQCGDGWAAEEAWRRVTRSYVRGLDTSPTLIGLATGLRGVPGKVEFDTWDGRRLPLSDGSFDRVVSRFAIAQCPEPVLLLREMHRVLSAGGELYLLEAGRDPGAWGAEPTAGVAELRGLLGSAGFIGVEEPAPTREGGLGALILRAQRSPESPRPHASCE